MGRQVIESVSYDSRGRAGCDDDKYVAMGRGAVGEIEYRNVGQNPVIGRVLYQNGGKRSH